LKASHPPVLRGTPTLPPQETHRETDGEHNGPSSTACFSLSRSVCSSRFSRNEMNVLLVHTNRRRVALTGHATHGNDRKSHGFKLADGIARGRAVQVLRATPIVVAQIPFPHE